MSRMAECRPGGCSKKLRNHIYKQQVLSRDSKLEMAWVFKLSKSTSSDVFPPTRSHQLGTEYSNI